MPNSHPSEIGAWKRPMRLVLWAAVGMVLLLALGAYLTKNLGLPPWTWIEKSRFVTKAEAALATVAAPTLPSGMVGDVFTYPDGWIVILYGQSRTTGHGLWNYNLAKDSSGREYVSEGHFCQNIRSRYDQRKKSDDYYLKTNPDATLVPNYPDPDFERYKQLIEASSLADAAKILTSIDFVKR
jgi:hypothetical protein